MKPNTMKRKSVFLSASVLRIVPNGFRNIVLRGDKGQYLHKSESKNLACMKCESWCDAELYCWHWFVCIQDTNNQLILFTRSHLFNKKNIRTFSNSLKRCVQNCTVWGRMSFTVLTRSQYQSGLAHILQANKGRLRAERTSFQQKRRIGEKGCRKIIRRFAIRL